MSEYILNEAQEVWLQLLESGEYSQGKGCLRSGDRYCCLGVACIAAGKSFDGSTCEGHVINAPPQVANYLRLRANDGQLYGDQTIADKSAISLAHANDQGATFSEIAAFIRSNPHAVFTD
ncbi:MAG: hypothetical protein V4628_18380 [Pseudomonadota bacterium]